MAAPRLGTGAGLAALRAQAEKRADWPAPRRPDDSIRRMLDTPAPIPEPRRGDVSAIRQAAAEVAQQLGPLPNALAEITTIVRRHCAPPDEELVTLLDVLQDRTFELWKAVTTLALATRRPASP